MRIPEHKFGIYLLACVCGLVDVTSFVGLHGVFSAMMTGNMLLFAVALSEGQPFELGFKYLRALIGFAVGVIVATRMMKACGAGNRSRKVFWFVWLLIGLAMLLAFWRQPETHHLLRDVLVNLLSMSMGAMTVIIRVHGIPDLATTLFTGTYTALIAESPLGGSKSDRWLRRLISILLFISSAALGGYLAKINPAYTLGLAFVVMSMAMVIFQKSAQEQADPPS
ncbi:YoaK family protein [Polynucleobacter sp. es-EL-1]|uniref:YoaK family protein n=1 Tax=Polynucleobacter sp. es-EL-1 TaxID=1855652 RepID=UPI001BFE6929|nr:YoaK family protein [Polynucleobacter sp. es-EL-1]QWE10575.1 DUF1275 domain-containing protein [Polynucleobacter sp. es-EL-1]